MKFQLNQYIISGANDVVTLRKVKQNPPVQQLNLDETGLWKQF